MEEINKKFPLVILAMALSIFLAVGTVGMGNALAAICGDIDYDGIHDIDCNCGQW